MRERPSDDRASLDWPTGPFRPHQVAASRRLRTEARPWRRILAHRGIDIQGPLQKPHLFMRAFPSIFLPLAMQPDVVAA